MAQILISGIKQAILSRKTIVHDTKWRKDDQQPKYTPYEVTRPCPAGWTWRSLRLEDTEGQTWRLLFEVNPRLGKWKAWLIAATPGTPPFVVARLEDQPGNQGGGLHIHADCGTRPDVKGAESVKSCYTLPDHGRKRRRRSAWTMPSFCRMAGAIFRTDPIIDQEEMEL